ncbi:hypothetical protein Lal_00019222 [Lupinus albus]|nr:hypothetical protein Lal_00019222 [Lupinus albus]
MEEHGIHAPIHIYHTIMKEDLEGIVHAILLEEKIFLRSDLNGHVGRDTRGFKDFHGGYEIGETNMEGRIILDFSSDFSFYHRQKGEEHLIAYKSQVAFSQFDFLLVRKSDIKFCLDCKVIHEESLTTQHRILVMELKVKNRVKRKG